MGVEHELVDTKHGRRYELGRRFGLLFYDRDMGAIRSDGREALAAALLAEWSSCVGDLDAEDIATVGRIASDIWTFMESAEWQVEISNDHTNQPDEWRSWPTVGSRYAQT